MKIDKEIILENGKKLTLSDPKLSDAKMLLEHLYICATETPFLLAYAPDIKKRSIRNEKKWVKSFLESKNLLIVVKDEGRVIGLAELRLFNGHKTSHRGGIGISIQERYWGMGIGSMLFDEMIAYAKKMQLEQLELGVVDANQRARHLYEKKGFEYTGKYPKAIKNDNGTYFDELLLTKFLK